ncbi:MAG: hypothetical protein NVS3B25_09840 [Hymenobacter sp.]
MSQEAVNRFEDKLDRIIEGQHVFHTETVATLRVQAEQLSEHMRRTELLENDLEVQRNLSTQRFAALVKDLKPLTRSHYMWSGVGKAIALIGTLIGVLEAVFAAAKHLR